MKKLIIICLLIYPFISAGQTLKSSGPYVPLHPREVTINVFFEGYDPKVNAFRFLKLICFPLYNGVSTATICEIDSSGKGSITFPLLTPQEIMLLADGSFAMMYASPGHTTNVYFDLPALQARKQLPATGNITALPLRFSGDLAGFNEHFNGLWPQLHSLLPQEHQKKMIDSLEQTAYKSYRLAVMSTMQDTLALFNRQHNTSKDFREAMLQYIRYWAAEDLVRYSWLHRQGKPEQLSENYPDFLKQIPVNNTKALVTGKYPAFLREYLGMWQRKWKYIPVELTDEQLYTFLKADAGPLSQEEELAFKTPAKNRSAAQEAMVSERHSLYGVKYGNFRNNLNMLDSLAQQLPPGIGTDLLLARIISDYLDQFKQPLSLRNMQLMNRHIGNQDICALVNRDNEQLRQKLAGTSPDNKEHNGFKQHQEALYRKLLTPYSGKVVYIDFWAPWCAPCVGEIPASRALAKELKNKDIVFLYIGVECDKELWEAAVKKMFEGGAHYFADKNESALLEAKFNFSGIPRYVLVDKTGKVRDENAPGPGRGAELKSKINDLLENTGK